MQTAYDTRQSYSFRDASGFDKIMEATEMEATELSTAVGCKVFRKPTFVIVKDC